MGQVINKSFFAGIWENWQKDLRDNKPLFWLEMFGTFVCMIASSTLAFTAPHPNLLLVYGAYMTGSSTLMITSYMRNNGFWVMLNAFFFSVDVIGLTNTLMA